MSNTREYTYNNCSDCKELWDEYFRDFPNLHHFHNQPQCHNCFTIKELSEIKNKTPEQTVALALCHLRGLNFQLMRILKNNSISEEKKSIARGAMIQALDLFRKNFGSYDNTNGENSSA